MMASFRGAKRLRRIRWLGAEWPAKLKRIVTGLRSRTQPADQGERRHGERFWRWVRRRRWHLGGIGVGTLGIVLTVLFEVSPSGPVADSDAVLPLSVAIRIVDGTGNVVNATNTRLLEYVLYREDRAGEWQYVTTSAAAGDEYTFLGIPEPGVYDIEAYDFGMFLGVATNVPARRGEMRLTIKASTRTPLRARTLDSTGPVSGVEIQVFTDQNQNEPMFTSTTNSGGEAELSVWPTIVDKEYYMVRALHDGKLVFSSQPVRVSIGRGTKPISITIDTGQVKVRAR